MSAVLFTLVAVLISVCRIVSNGAPFSDCTYTLVQHTTDAVVTVPADLLDPSKPHAVALLDRRDGVSGIADNASALVSESNTLGLEESISPAKPSVCYFNKDIERPKRAPGRVREDSSGLCASEDVKFDRL